MIGQTVSHYKIVEKLGEGGMGVVYKAEDTKLKRTVALKFLPPKLTQDKDAKKRFIHEAQAASALQHNNICTIHDIDETPDGLMFICMDCYEGETLKDKISKGPPPAGEVIDIVVQVAKGLSEAHEAGIVHRDIKPANILITRNGSVKILDFGLAKLTGLTRLTKTGTTVGTVAYMSPEQARGEETDSRSDIWSLGVVLYELLAGEAPFKGEHEAAVMYGIIHNDPKPLSIHGSDLPKGIQSILDKALRKEPAERYQSTTGLLMDLNLLRIKSVPQRSSEKKKRETIRRQIVTGGITVAAVILGFFIYDFFIRPDRSTPPSARKMIAVLPFENLGPLENEYFADGVTEEITARLARYVALGVISRTSAIQYKETDKTITQIGNELGVKYILEGTVRWRQTADSISQVRVTPQLINVADATHIWAEVYEEKLENIFAVQSDIASKVAHALNVTLLEAYPQNITTENTDAYNAYLQGIYYAAKFPYIYDKLEVSIKMFERAVNLDPTFALAYAELSRINAQVYHMDMDRTDERLAAAKAAVDQALLLAPNLPETRLALGYYYYHCLKDYERALEEFARAERGIANESRVLAATAYVERRLGRFESALEKLEQAFIMSPRESNLAIQTAWTCKELRQFRKAIDYEDRAISLDPDLRVGYLQKAITFQRMGDLVNARAMMEQAPNSSWYEGSLLSPLWIEQLLYERDYEAALECLASPAFPEFEDTMWRYWPKTMYAGLIHGYMGDLEKARAEYVVALKLLEEKIEEQPDDPRLYSALGIVCAGLGRKGDAIKYGKKGIELCPLTKDAVIAPTRIYDVALIYTMLGEDDPALEYIERVLSVPWFGASVSTFRTDPRWDAIRDHPRFLRLMERYAGAES